MARKRQENLKEGFGGAERDRTAGLLVANEALSQLSYSPTTYLVYQRVRDRESRRSALLLFGTDLEGSGRTFADALNLNIS